MIRHYFQMADYALGSHPPYGLEVSFVDSVKPAITYLECLCDHTTVQGTSFDEAVVKEVISQSISVLAEEIMLT